MHVVKNGDMGRKFILRLIPVGSHLFGVKGGNLGRNGAFRSLSISRFFKTDYPCFPSRLNELVTLPFSSTVISIASFGTALSVILPPGQRTQIRTGGSAPLMTCTTLSCDQ
jgi:hypothetical protein